MKKKHPQKNKRSKKKNKKSQKKSNSAKKQIKNSSSKKKENSSKKPEFTKKQIPNEDKITEQTPNEKIKNYSSVENKSTNIKVRDTDKDQKDITEALVELYQQDEEEQVEQKDYSEITHDKNAKLKRILFYSFLGLAVLAIATIAGFLIFNPTKKFAGDNIKIDINGPKELNAGQNVTYEINVSNFEDVNLTQTSLQLKFPDAFYLTDTQPTPSIISETQSNASWNLNTLKVGQTEKIKISGILMGEVDSTQVLSALLVYKPENFNYDFNEKNSLSTVINKATIETAVASPVQTLINESNKFKLSMLNASIDESVSKIRITALYSDNFVYETANPKPEKDNNVWEIKELKPEEEIEIEFQGKFTAEDDKSIDDQKFKILIELIGQNNNNYLQEKIEFTSQITNESLVLNQIINGSSDNKAINFSDALYYSIDYKNFGETELNDVIIFSIINPSFNQLIDWGSLEMTTSGSVTDDQNGKKISWNKDNISKLSSLQPGEEGTIEFYVYLNNYNDLENNISASDLTNAQINSKVQAEITKIISVSDDEKEEQKETRTSQGNEITTPVNSFVDFTSQGRYYDDNNINVGSGPIPPQIGKKTTYQIWWDITNTTHEIQDLEITTTLENKVNWEDNYNITAGEINYDSSNRQLTWSINRIPENADTISVKFDISITPNDSDLGELIMLLNKSIFKAKDKQTESDINIINKVITTNLDDDENAVGNGIVVPAL